MPTIVIWIISVVIGFVAALLLRRRLKSTEAYFEHEHQDPPTFDGGRSHGGF